MSAEDLSDDAIYASASEPARDEQGRFAAPEPREQEQTTQETVPAEQETPTPNLGQLPSQGEQGQPEGGEAQPAQPQEPQQSPRERGLFADLKGEREKRQKYEADLAARDREMAELRGQMAAYQRFLQQPQAPQQPQTPAQPQQAPDPFEDPPGFAAFQAQQVFEKQFQPVAERMRQQEEHLQRVVANLNRGHAEVQHGADVVKSAEEAFNTAAARGQIDPLEHQRINNSPNPWAAAVEWHRRQQAFTTTGGDPEGWFKTEFERRLQSDPAFQQQAFALLQGQAQAAGAQAPAAGRQAPLIVPPSLNNAAGASARGQQSIGEEDIFAAAPNKMGGRRG